MLFSSVLSHRAANREDVAAIATEVSRLRDDRAAEMAGLRRGIDQHAAISRPVPPRASVRQLWRRFLAGRR